MRKYFLTAFVMAAMLVFATSGFALEKTAVQYNGDNLEEWNAGSSTCSIFYYNTCTGWVWIWSGWSPGDVFGTCFTSCCPSGQLTTSYVRVWSSYPTGYGFTSTIAVANVDANCCPTGNVASTVFFPTPNSWNAYAWNVNVGSTFAVTITSGPGAVLLNPMEIGTDHPAAGPTGPQSCGACYPNPRSSNTYYWGSVGAPLCPGVGLSDGICDSELLQVAIVACPVSVEEASWGSIKNLYR